MLNGESVERHGTVQARWREWLLWEIWKNLGVVHHACQWAVDKMAFYHSSVTFALSSLLGCILEGREGWDTEHEAGD